MGIIITNKRINFKQEREFKVKLYIFIAFEILDKVAFLLRIMRNIIFISSFVRYIYCMRILIKRYFNLIILAKMSEC